ncbi:MAG: TerB family tellurite resistance protein [Vicinamibacterales bacterium]
MGRGQDLLRWLGVEQAPSEPEVLDAISAVLDRLEETRARHVAAFAYLLGRVAGADHHVSDEEKRLMTQLVSEESGLRADEASAVVTLALDEFRRFGGTHNLIVAREFASLATFVERLALLRCLFAISAADSAVQVREDNEIRQISRELKIEHADFVRARTEVRDHLAVLRRQGT